MNRRPRFYFSLRSPYSWLAHRDLLATRPAVLDQLEWIPFWEPDDWSTRLLTEAGAEFPYTVMSRPKQLYVLRDVARLAASRGLRVRWPIDREPRWEVPHLAYLVAARDGLGPAFVATAYRVRWEENGDICDPEVVAAIAGEIGAAADECAAAAESPRWRRAGLEALLAAVDEGVFGVPFFARGYDKYWGVDRLPLFLDAISAAEVVPAGVADSVESDGGHAGGCG
ncbi:2-hydroxychromene-2-carboxylate isomerase [Amycolatopsis sp. YIM 10]|uniref:2-hydroxychromene-2-carboxylate isomerase n=1 Tax=Amycolatopsis sp. YIM 10 TaxID=2653857 RepID=UPI0012900634|nr:DsbA family protein [Amycolatopsis sp. YIM 10]QFU90536.1 2-hydroxychromene-2-carboxylate isomerase [Amycolatopsis sp. YIM 10]